MANDQEQPIQRLAGDVLLDAGILLAHQAKTRGLAGEGVVLLGQADLVGGLGTQRGFQPINKPGKSPMAVKMCAAPAARSASALPWPVPPGA